jgi:mannose-1-phosphate guanylyltransferase
MVVVVVLCGEMTPNKLQLSMFGDKYNLLEETLLRTQQLDQPCSRLIIICNQKNQNDINQSLLKLKLTLPITVIFEPLSKNTGPALGCLVKYFEQYPLTLDNDQECLVLPSDHVLSMDSLNRSMGLCSQLIKSKIVTFGVTPPYPEVEYGYIIEGDNQQIKQFIEKPCYDMAKQLILNPMCYWNSGIYYFNLAAMTQEYHILQPSLLESIGFLKSGATSEIYVNNTLYQGCLSGSFDKLIMEQTVNGCVVPFRGLWSDIGSWSEIYQVSKDFKSLNCTEYKTSKCHLFNYYSKQKVVVVGVDDLCILNTKDVVVVSQISAVDKVKQFAKMSEHQSKSNRYTDMLGINIMVLLMIMISMIHYIG